MKGRNHAIFWAMIFVCGCAPQRIQEPVESDSPDHDSAFKDEIGARICPPPGTLKDEVMGVFGKGAPFRVKGAGEEVWFYSLSYPVTLEVFYDERNRVTEAYLNHGRSVINAFPVGSAEDWSRAFDEIDKRFPQALWKKES